MLSSVEGCGDMTCCDGSDLTIVVMSRITIDGRLEISIDGGGVWTPSPNDPSSHVVEYPPPVDAGVSATKCDAASNGKQHYLDLIAEVSNGFDTTATLLDFLKLVADIVLDILLVFLANPEGIPFVDALIEMLFGTVKAVYAAHKTAWDDYWTSDETDKILCALYCNISDDGRFTSDQYAAFVSKLKADLTPSAQKDLFINIITSTGVEGVNKLCAYGSAADSDCSSCACGCLLSDWTEINSQPVTRPNDGVIEVAGYQLGGGDVHYYAGIEAPSDSGDCREIAAEVISGDVSATGNIRFWSECGEGVVTTHASPFFGSGVTCYRTIYYQSDNPFTVRFTCFVDCD